MTKRLVIVESPSKSKTIEKYLGTDEVVVIPSSYEENGERIDVVEISSKAFLDNTFIKKVIFVLT